MIGKMASNLFIAMAIGLYAAPLAHAEKEEKEEKRTELKKLSDYSNDQKLDRKRLEYLRKADEQNMFLMKKYKALLNNKENRVEGAQRQALRFRLAEKYNDKGEYFFQQEMLAFEEELEKCDNTPGCDDEKIKEDHTKSIKWRKKAIREYEVILDDAETYPRADEVLFSLGAALKRINKPKKAVKQYIRLTKEYSSSKYLPDAYINIGEHYFDNNNAFKALKAYKQATKYKNSDKFVFALYKLGWCYFNVQDYDQAIAQMKSVVSFSMKQQSGKSPKGALKDDALRDLVRFFADADQIEEAYTYFTKLGKKELIIKALKRLAKKAFDDGKFQQSIQTYRRLIAEDPNDPKAPSYYNEIITAYQSLGQKDKTLMELKNLLKKYGKKSQWAKSNSSNPSAIKKAQGFVEKGLRKVANSYHREAQKLGRGPAALETYGYAEDAYRAYLDQFPEGKYVYTTRYGFGELLYTLGEYYQKKSKSLDKDGSKTKKYFSQAFSQYSQVVKLDPNGKHSQECAKNTMYTAREMVRQENKEGLIKKRKNNTDIEPIELSVWERKLLEAMDNYALVYPKSKETINFLYESAELLFAKNRLDEASKRYERVISIKPKSKQATQSAEGIAEALAFRANAKTTAKDFPQAIKDYTSLRDTSRAFYEKKGLGNKKFKKEMYEYFELAYGKLVQIKFDSSDKGKEAKQEAAVGYIDFAKTFPKSKMADSAINDAAVFYYQINMMADFISTRLMLIEQYPKSKFYIESISTLGYSYEAIANFKEATVWFEKLFELDPKHPEAENALFTAGYFSQRLGDWKKAIKFRRDFMKTFPDSDRSKMMGLDIANIYLSNKQYDKAISEFSSFYNKPPKGTPLKAEFYARLQHGLILKTKGETKTLLAHWKKTLTAYDKISAKGDVPLDELRLIIAEVKFYLALQKHAGFNKIKISGPSGSRGGLSRAKKVLNKQFTEKTTKQKELKADFTEIVKLNAGKWTLAAIVEIAKSYDNWADTVQNSYIPAFDNDEQKEIYGMKMEDRAFPIREKAISFYSQALAEAYKNSIYTDSTAEAARRLGELKPTEFTQLTETVPKPNYLSSQPNKPRTFLDKVE